MTMTVLLSPDDQFGLTEKPRGAAGPDEPMEFRLKCFGMSPRAFPLKSMTAEIDPSHARPLLSSADCPGKVYKPGPGETLENFAAHLRFTGHIRAVASRLEQESANQ